MPSKTKSKNKIVVEKKEKESKILTLVERCHSEGNEKASKGHKRENTRMAFAIWLSIPTRYKGAPDNVVKLLGIDDSDTLELIGMKSQKDFGLACNVGEASMTRWRKDFEEGKEDTVRPMFKKLMRELLGALYQKGLEFGDAERFKVFANYVEGWVPMSGLQHSGEIKTGLSDEEKKQLDKLMEKNTI